MTFTTSPRNSDPKIVLPAQSSLRLDAAAVPVDGHGEGDAVVAVGQQWQQPLSAVLSEVDTSRGP